jgi:small subunit ribosomal protein S16
MLTIRLFRVGRKNQPAFKIVVTDKRNSSTRGRFVEEVGVYNPLTKQRNLKGDRVKYWMSVGAKPSPTVHNMLVADKVVEAPKIAKHKKSKKVAEVPTVETPMAAPAIPEPTSETAPEAEKPAVEAASETPAPEPASAPESAPATETSSEEQK